jgi:hypothetical protein
MRLVAAIIAAAVAAPAGAQTSPPAPPGERYAMQPANGGVLRMDRETGAVTFCKVEDGVASCRLAAEERAAFEAEIARLRAENERLRAGLAPAPRGALPSEQEFERALSFTERFLRRIMRLFKEESPPGGTL